MSIQTAFLQQSGNSAGKEHHEPGILRQRRAPHRGTHSQRQSAGSHRHTSWASWPAIDAGTILAGMVSGLASTGLHQAFKQLVGDN